MVCLCHSCESRNPKKSINITNFLNYKSSIYLALCWIPAYAGMTFGNHATTL
ncbi:MAG TPA: hypothetical protein LFV92_05030 [Rickettsia endosymbiont of Ceroptres masudai]|nr:hypothetical protein [Rickettsia endosymbiont of Ceroptres masudai]